MAKNYIRFSNGKTVDWGKTEHGNIFPLNAGDLNTKDFLEFLKNQKKEKPAKSLPFKEVSVLSPITAPCQIICQGANYRQHLIESGLNPDHKRYNMFFTKSDASLCPPIGEVIRPSHVKLLDYEIELGLVFGKPVSKPLDPKKTNVSDYIAAFFMANDVSARDIQLPQMQWYKGKSYRTFCPTGPVLSVLEQGDFELLESLELTLLVNDTVRQHDKAANLVYKPLETLLELSTFCDISVGDVLLTGTPSGCALRAPGKFIQKIGALLSESKKWELFIKGQSKRTEYLKQNDMIRSSIRTADRRIDLGEQMLKVTEEK
ncbi:fumarylacetoacetate hydrolase family protein [Leptospira ilyithenensis]|uniref:Fumarylacetoacetate hydrolase family protein n=1 Tax=Leptospira ilyithenensis TaxID=2484901 RepID=A0A4R9LW10_9LEPT|nr:fumarylacetoacetate hydrolase family protein [Leptospira ilyithenensis]TGN16804.1 fumarylacetoacetate hydrolase family protein [Leptospira ilyithenensis]